MRVKVCAFFQKTLYFQKFEIKRLLDIHNFHNKSRNGQGFLIIQRCLSEVPNYCVESKTHCGVESKNSKDRQEIC